MFAELMSVSMGVAPSLYRLLKMCAELWRGATSGGNLVPQGVAPTSLTSCHVPRHSYPHTQGVAATWSHKEWRQAGATRSGGNLVPQGLAASCYHATPQEWRQPGAMPLLSSLSRPFFFTEELFFLTELWRVSIGEAASWCHT